MKTRFLIFLIYSITQLFLLPIGTAQATEEKQVFDEQEMMLLIQKVLATSSNKIKTFNRLKNLFAECEKNAKNKEIKNFCKRERTVGLGDDDTLSLISFEEVWNDLNSEIGNRRIPQDERSIFSMPGETAKYPYGNLNSLEFPRTYVVDLQPYLESGNFYYTVGYNRDGGPNEIGILVIKPGDSNWQSLVKIRNNFSDIGLWGSDSLSLDKGVFKITLREQILKNEDTGESDNYVLTYTLQEDKSRKLESCEKTPHNNTKTKKISLKECQPISKHFNFSTQLP